MDHEVIVSRLWMRFWSRSTWVRSSWLKVLHEVVDEAAGAVAFGKTRKTWKKVVDAGS